MLKLISIVSLVVVVSACSVNPVEYDQFRKLENAQHDKMMG